MGGTLRRAPGVLWLSTVETVVALPSTGTTPAVIAGSGAGVWQVFAEPKSLQQAVGALAARYDLPPEQIRSDVEAAVERLVELGLIEEVA